MLSYPRRLILLLLTLAAGPVLAVLAAALLFFNLLHRLTRFTRRALPERGRSLSGLASIVILNWNGKDLLEQGLPSVLEAVRRDGRPHEVLVVDNGSGDGSVPYLEAEFPEVRVLPLAQNLGFSGGNNAGVRAARHDVVVLLNNDMVVDPGFLRPLLEGFGPRTFAVTSQIYLQDESARREETGMTTARFRRGMIDFSHRDLDGKALPRPYYPAFWAGGGSSAFDRARFLALGGLQEIYSPAYVEDTDLSYSAWRMGWEVLFAPRSIVYHKHRASSRRRFTPEELQALILRNQFMFIWKNIRSWRLLLSHCVFLPWNCYRLARDFGPRMGLGLLRAILSLPHVQIAKLGSGFRGLRSDGEVFDLFRKPGLYFRTQGGTGSLPMPDENHPRSPEEAKSGLPRILWLTAYLPHTGRHAGAGRMYQMLKCISASYRVTLLTFLESAEEREFLPEVEALCERVVAVPRTPPLRWQLFAYEPFDEFRTPEMEDSVQDCLENCDFSLMQLEYTQMACYADKAFGIPTLLTKHEIDFASCARRARVEPGIWKKLRWFYNYLQVLDREMKLLRRVDAAICMTEPDAQKLRQYGATVPLQVINTGVDLDYFRPPVEPATEPRMVFVGAFQHLPNVDAMIYFCSEILPRIRVQIPSAEFIIVGSNPPPAVSGLTAIPGVRVTGIVPDIRPYMASSSLYVVPMRLGVGIRGKILEAWGMALPVVASSVASAGLRTEDGKNLVIADSPTTFAARTVALLKDPARREELGKNGRRTAEQYYGWETAAGQLDSLYRSFL